MRAAMPNNLFSPTVEWSIPAPVLYVSLGIIGACLLLHLLIVVARYIERVEGRHRRFERLARDLGLTPAEMVCLSRCGNDLGVEDKSQLLTEPDLFQQMQNWAEKDRARRVLIKRIRAKLEAHGRVYTRLFESPAKPAATTGRKNAVRRSSPLHA